LYAAKKRPAQFPTGKQEQEDGGQLPNEKPTFDRQARHSQRECNQIGEKGQACVRSEKLPADGKQFRVQNLFDAGQINFRILGKGMVSVNQQSGCGQEQENKRRFELVRSDSVPR
jgi:hypothetical protein